MRQCLTLLLCTLSVLYASAQEERALGVFTSDTNWIEEIIPFPLGFAPKIEYDGYEDLRFATQWNDSSHEAFWTYTFAWHVKSFEELDEHKLETKIKYYYDGLMTAVNKKKGFEVPETIVLFTKANTEESTVDYIGKIRVHDSFHSERIIILRIKVKIYPCNLNDSATIVFRISPQDFDHHIWNRFNEIQLRSEHCD